MQPPTLTFPDPLLAHERHHPAKQRGGRSLCRPQNRRTGSTYFRLLIAVRSAENLTMPVALHQLEPRAVAPVPGLIAVTKFGLALVVEKSEVKALQEAFDRLVSV